MEQVRLGSTGLKVSRLCLGCMTYGSPEWRSWVLDMEQSKPFFQAAIEKGITFFDTANVYSIGASEEVTARRSVPGGTSNEPAGPSVETSPWTRDSRTTRGSPRSVSCPTTYQRPRKDTTPHGCR